MRINIKDIIYDACDLCNMGHDSLSIGFVVCIFLPCYFICCLIITPFYFLGYCINHFILDYINSGKE